MAQVPEDQHLVIDDSDRESIDIQNLSADHVSATLESNENAFDKALDIVAAIDDSEAEMHTSGLIVIDGEPKRDSDTAGQAQNPMSGTSQSPHRTAAVDSPSLLLELGNDLEGPEQLAEVVDANQEWEICDIIGKEDVNGVVHYLVEWNPTLMPKYALAKAKGLVNKFEARLRAQSMQENGRGDRPS
jgi:hypothetical protein